MIIQISQNEHDPLERIAAIIKNLPNKTMSEDEYGGNRPMDLMSQCLQHTTKFLNAHPDVIESFLRTIDLPSSPSNTPFRHDRHLNLISALSQSSSPLFIKLSEPLLDPTFPLDSLLSPRSFTDPASSFFRLASTNPSFFHRIVDTHAGHILDMAISTAVSSVRVMSDEPSEPRCLDFGRATQNLVVLLQALAEVSINPNLSNEAFNSLASSLLTLLVLSAASTNDDMSTAAVLDFSNLFGLTLPHTEALLFVTSPTFPLSDALTPRHSQEWDESDHKKSAGQSICAEAGRCVMMMSHSDNLSTINRSDFSKMIGIHFAGCLVNALHSTTTLPHSFPFFSPELCGLSEQESVWNDGNNPSALAVLKTLADISLNLAFSVSSWDRTMSQAEEEKRDIIFLHLFPFLCVESQARCLSSFRSSLNSQIVNAHRSLDRVLEYLVEMTTVNSVNTPIALHKEMRHVARFLLFINPETHCVEATPTHVSHLEMSIIEKLTTAEGDVRLNLLTSLAVISRDDPDLVDELMTVESDAQALLLFSLPIIRSTPYFDLFLDRNHAAFNRVVELARHLDNLPLVAAALGHLGVAVERFERSPFVNAWLDIDQLLKLQEIVINTLRVIVQLRREGVEEGCVVGKDGTTSLVIDSCLKVLRFLMHFESFDPTPVIETLVSLAVTTDLYLLRSILLVLEEIEWLTQNTPTPFSICTVTAPFRGMNQSSATQQPLPYIVSSIILFASLNPPQSLSQQYHSLPSSGFTQTTSQTDHSFSPDRVLTGMNVNLLLNIAKETAKSVCLILEKRRASSSRGLISNDPLEISLAQSVTHITPQHLFLILYKLILPDNPGRISTSSLVPHAPFLTRILTILVPSSPDGSDHFSMQLEHMQLLNVFLTLVLALTYMGTLNILASLPLNTVPLFTPPLTSLISVISIALVRLDTIPSSLDRHYSFCDMFRLNKNRSNPQIRQVVLALCEEGMEDRCEHALDSFSLTFLNIWKGANIQSHVHRMIYDRYAPFDIHPVPVLGNPVHLPLDRPPDTFNGFPVGRVAGPPQPLIRRIPRQPGGLGAADVPFLVDNGHPQSQPGGSDGESGEHISS
ncbi:hypothetical protein BLNAU_9334 [Blattamonas nauphoetae]|uniref:Uncharacterized protein n=1 Tax=Blattamonas nauphoetae TaxID=2049346 RepID=A0ABQ9XVZ8_9EUKA|nr:hypothetical protein BLNAU_9334 [Blattamonas nauphoetae]